MPIRDAVQARVRALKAGPPQRARLRASSPESERSTIPDPSNAARHATLYANLSPLQTAIGAVARAVATTPFSVSQRTKGGLKAIEDHPFELLLERPNDREGQFEFLVNTASWLSSMEQCYWWLNTTGEAAPPEEIWVIPTTKIAPVPDGNMGIRGYIYDNGSGNYQPLNEWEVVHFKGWNPSNEYVGLSGLQALGTDATADLAAQRFSANFYGKHSAKMAGILAFADAIDQDKWNRLLAARNEEHGGTQNNRIMMLRNVGAGGVQWLPTQLSQTDIQYLEQRRYTKEEIFERFAPGLASILAINATEANSTAGKDTFYEFAVFALNTAIASKITHKLLPLYSEGLVGAFEDVRRVDTQIELLEQAEYSKTHTVDEIRARFYQDKPIGDDRGTLLPAEVGSGPTDTRNPADKPPPVPFGQPTLPMDALAQAQKRLDRERWERKVLKGMAAGRLPGDVIFDPDYLSDTESMPIRAALKRAQSAADVQRVFEEQG